MINDNITFLGKTNFRNIEKKFGIKLDDRRKHIYVIGKTGMGKTTLLANMAAQDIHDGFGVAFIDPHGEQAEELLDYVPKERIEDVVYFNPSDISWPIGFNIMEVKNPEVRHLIASGLMGVFKKIWPDVWSARMEYILNNSILALLEYPGSTLLGINRMLADAGYREEVIEQVSDPVVKAFWTQEFARYTQRYEVEATAAIQNKVGQFISNPLIRNIIGQKKSSIDMRQIMDEKKILIVNLSKGRMGEANSMLLGALIITKLYLGAMSRVEIEEGKRNDFFLYVDEFQNFATESFANILSEARKYRLSLVMAHQYIAQMEEMVRDAVFGNAGTLISFRVGAEDGEYLEKEFAPVFAVGDLVNLPKFNIYIKLMIDGVAGRPFSAVTLPPLLKQQHSHKEEIIKKSRQKYAAPREEIEKAISVWAKVETDTSQTSKPKPKPKPKKKKKKKPKDRVIIKPVQREVTEPISLKQAFSQGPTSFAVPKNKKDQKRTNAKEKVDVKNLRQAIESALDETDLGLVKDKTGDFQASNKSKQKGFLKPGEKVIFD